jgi:hypothetical protein
MRWWRARVAPKASVGLAAPKPTKDGACASYSYHRDSPEPLPIKPTTPASSPPDPRKPEESHFATDGAAGASTPVLHAPQPGNATARRPGRARPACGVRSRFPRASRRRDTAATGKSGRGLARGVRRSLQAAVGRRTCHAARLYSCSRPPSRSRRQISGPVVRPPQGPVNGSGAPARVPGADDDGCRGRCAPAAPAPSAHAPRSTASPGTPGARFAPWLASASALGARTECSNRMPADLGGTGQLEQVLRVDVDRDNRHRLHRALGLEAPDTPSV